jgi:hypothetical protein
LVIYKYTLYSKEQSSTIRQAFWTAFGQFMALQPTADGGKVNWINYKTGIKYLHFRMQADQRQGRIAIEITHPDLGIQELMFEQFSSYQKIIAGYLQEEWKWTLHDQDEYGKTISSISTSITNVNIFRQEDWPALISFFKSRIMALDEFWSDTKHGFDLFR